MADKNYFPKDFLFGAATSAYQFEGAAREEGKGPSVQDVKKIKRGQLDFSVAADHYHHLDEDLNLLTELGVKSYRFSISWSRIMPAGTGAVNQAGLAFYHRLIAGLLERDIVPIVTLFHFDLLAKLEEEGGWANRQTITAFVDYAKVLFAEFGADVPYWLTINEQNAMVLAGGTVAASAASFQASFTGNHNMLLAQARVFADYHAGHYLGTIGPAPNIVAVYPATDSAEDAWAAENFSALRNWLFLDPVVFGHYNHLAVSVLNRLGIKIPNEPGDMETLAAGKPDFIAFNYYNSSTVKAAGMLDALKKGEQQSAFTLPGFFSAVANKNFAKTDFGWEIDPKGLRTTANQIYSRYGLPLMITENGIGLRE